MVRKYPVLQDFQVREVFNLISDVVGGDIPYIPSELLNEIFGTPKLSLRDFYIFLIGKQMQFLEHHEQ